LVALIWKAYRVIDERLGEIQADIRALRGGVSHLFLLASKSEAKTASENAGKVAHKGDDLAFVTVAWFGSRLGMVDGLCAKLITLVPPAKAAPLISEVCHAKAAPISEMTAERHKQFGGRKLIVAWTTPSPHPTGPPPRH
jgi:hypothetical protein